MNFTTFIFFYVTALASLVAALPLMLRDVYVPPVLTPNAATEWTVNSTQTVTWDVSSPPGSITNRFGSIRLRRADRTLPIVLADGFDILDGSIEITVPWVTEGNYSIVLFGDSGNFSPVFSIVGGPEF